MSKDRIWWIDNVKGIAILLVIWGHLVLNKNQMYYYITSFHVQIFLIISGFLYYGLKKVDYKHIIKKCAIPYLYFSIIGIIIDCIYTVVINGNLIKNALLNIYKTISLFGMHSIWYLPTYCIASIVFLKSKKKLQLSMICLLLNLFLASLLVASKSFLPNTVYVIIYYPFSLIIRIFISVFLISIGYYYKYSQINEKLNIINKILLSLFLLVISYYISTILGETNFSSVQYGSNMLLYYLLFIAGAFAIIVFISIFNNKIFLLSYFGKNSLILLITHSTLKITILIQSLVSIFIQKNSFFYGIICLVLLLIVEIPIIEIINKKMDFLINYKNKLNSSIVKRINRRAKEND